MKNHNFYDNCMLCPRTCGAQRSKGKTGICGVTETLKVARAALHFWEEPCISGTKGSGAVFFSGCALHCVFCQNEPIAQGTAGKEITPERLVEIFLELQEQGANNINLVTPGQYVPHIIRAVEQARRQGLAVPIVYNTGSYENVDTIKALEGIVDIYLPDFKYMDPFLAAKYSHAPDYPQTAKGCNCRDGASAAPAGVCVGRKKRRRRARGSLRGSCDEEGCDCAPAAFARMSERCQKHCPVFI